MQSNDLEAPATCNQIGLTRETLFETKEFNEHDSKITKEPANSVITVWSLVMTIEIKDSVIVEIIVDIIGTEVYHDNIILPLKRKKQRD